MRQVTTFGKVEKGKIFIHKLKRMWEAVLSLGEGPFLVIVKRNYGKRSNEQNKYYWGVVIPAFMVAASDSTGEEWAPSQVHETLKAAFLFEEIAHFETGQIIRKVKSTSDLSTVEFNEYIDKCRNFVFEWFGAYVPEPNEDMDKLGHFEKI